jgi:hypothetical protein
MASAAAQMEEKLPAGLMELVVVVDDDNGRS